MDEKAFAAAHAEYIDPLRKAITAYEQARERVAVPTREEVAVALNERWGGLAWGDRQEGYVNEGSPVASRGRFLNLADYVLTLLRHGPSAHPESVIINGVSMSYPEAMRRVHESHKDACLRYAEQIRNLEKRAKRAEDQAGKSRCERDEAEAIRNLAVEREQDAEKRAETAERDLATLRESLRVSGEERDQLERDLAAERAAHEATRAEYKGLLVTAHTHEAAAEKRAAELERELDQWKETATAANRAMCEARERAAELERERYEVRAKLDGCESNYAKLRAELESSERELANVKSRMDYAESKLATFEGTTLDEALEVLQGLASYVGANGSHDPKSPQQLNERIRWGIDHEVTVWRKQLEGFPSQRMRAEAAECERDALKAKLEALREAWGSLNEDGWSAIAERAKRLQAVLSPEPAKPAPDLDLAGRVVVMETGLKRATDALFHLVQDMTTDPALNHDTQLSAQEAWAILRGEKSV